MTGALAGAAVGVVGGAGGAWTWGQSRLKAERPEDSRLSFSQQGEDIVLYHVLHDLLKLERPTYMDVGAAHPVRASNTYLLWGTGSRGVLVEPNPALAEMLRDWRPGDTVVEAGIGVTDQAEADYYEIKGNPMLNTFSPDQVAYLQKGKTESVVERVVKMPLLNINRVIDEQLAGKAPDLLSTDIEGLDFAIIQTLDLSRFRPGAICAETVAMYNSSDFSEISKYLLAQDYEIRGGSTINTIYVDRRRLS
jgi:FkbM family methyltransferase